MRSPGARRMIHTRVRSFSDKSVEPTQGFGFLLSRSNSAVISAGHGSLCFFMSALSAMVSTTGIPPLLFAVIYSIFRRTERLRNIPVAGSGQRRAVIMGGSMSGLLSGLLLRRAGLAVDIFGRGGCGVSGRVGGDW